MARTVLALVLLVGFATKVPTFGGFRLPPDLTALGVVRSVGKDVVLPLIELALGAWLFTGKHPRGARVATQGLFILFGAYHVVLILKGRGLTTCNCFGAGIPLTHSLMALLTGACLLLTVPLTGGNNYEDQRA